MLLKYLKFFLFFLIPFNFSYAEKVNIFGSIKNGTTAGIGKADSIKLLALQSAMLPLAEIGPQTGTFRFPAIDAPDGAPILMQVVYKGVNYNKMIPPVDRFRTISQEITVFEVTNSWENVSVKSLMQVIREKSGLRIFKLFLIDNQSKPAQSFFSADKPIEYFIPKDAKDIFAQIQQPGSKMAIPLQTPDGKNGGKILDRAVLPGISELQISYLLPKGTDSFEERLLIEGESGSFPVFVKPADMTLEVLGGGSATKLEKDIPSGLSAYAISSNLNPKVIQLNFVGGSPIPTALKGNPEVVNGTILTTWDTSTFAVIGFLALLFSLSFVFVYKKSPSKV